MKRNYVKELYQMLSDGFGVEDMVDVYNYYLLLWFKDDKTVMSLTGKSTVDFVNEAIEIFDPKIKNFYELLTLAQYLF